jgi:hypothetical protein
MRRSPFFARPRRAAFTLAEAMIALCGSTVIVGALLFSSVHLQRCLHGAEESAAEQADQRRLLDYVARDVRRSIGLATTDSVGAINPMPFSNGTMSVQGTKSLLVTLPAYYQSQLPADSSYDQPLGVVASDNYVDYGKDGAHAPATHVIFRKQFDEAENCVCFVRIEENTRTVIVRGADPLSLQIEVAPDGRTCTIQSTYISPFDHKVVITEREDVLLRNIRTDGT